VNINDETLRVTWDDGEGTHPLVHLIEHGLTFEEGADGEPALDLMMEEPPLRRIRSAQAESATSSSGGSTSSSDGEADDSDRPPLETAHTKAGVSWKHEPEGIRTDNRTRSLDEDPSFACGNANITTLIGLFLYLMCPAFGAGAVEHTNAMYPDPCDHTSLPELYIFYGYMACIAATAGSFALNDVWREQEMPDSFLPPPNIGIHGMSNNRFRSLLSHWRCGPAPVRTAAGPIGRVSWSSTVRSSRSCMTLAWRSFVAGARSSTRSVAAAPHPLQVGGVAARPTSSAQTVSQRQVLAACLLAPLRLAFPPFPQEGRTTCTSCPPSALPRANVRCTRATVSSAGEIPRGSARSAARAAPYIRRRLGSGRSMTVWRSIASAQATASGLDGSERPRA